MSDTTVPSFHLTSTQRGVIAETLISAQLMLISGGRFSTFTPQADDDGLDLIILDKLTRRTIPVQIKACFAMQDPSPATVQFDTRLKTFRELAGSYVLCAAIDPATAAIWRAWLIPMIELRSISNATAAKLAITPNPSMRSADRYTPWRCANVREVVDRLAGDCVETGGFA